MLKYSLVSLALFVASYSRISRAENKHLVCEEVDDATIDKTTEAISELSDKIEELARRMENLETQLGDPGSEVDKGEVLCRNDLSAVFQLRVGDRYSLTYKKAKKACLEYGARLATRAEVEQAQKDGLTCCICGWVDEKEALYPMNVEHEGCAGIGVNVCAREDADVYCHRDGSDASIDGGSGKVLCRNDLTNVFHLRKEGRYSLTYAYAEKACVDFGARIATRAEVTQAYNAGLTCCICGWVKEKEAIYPMNVNHGGCAGPGVNSCGVVDADVYCYQE